MRRIFHYLLFLLLLMPLLVPASAWAQEEEEPLILEVRKIFGFRFTNRIQGRFSLLVEGPEDLERVEILLDGEVIYEALVEPFKYEFETSQFSPGLHLFSALGYIQDGRILRSKASEYNILSFEEAQEGLSKYYLPLIIAIVVIIGLVGLFSSLMTRRKREYRIGEYGPAGGAVCRRCGMPFSRHVLSPNLMVGKLERCPNCGAVAVVRRGTQLELRQAEQRLLADLQGGQNYHQETEDERLKRMLDDSRFEM